MVQKHSDDPALLKTAIERFLKAKQDESSVLEVEQQLQLHLVGTTAYIPTFTRTVMDKHFGSPVMAVHTRTDEENKIVYIYPAKDPDARDAKRLRSTDAMGAAYVAFGVPLRKLKMKLNVTRRIILPLTMMEVPGEGIVYWASFADTVKERRDVDLEALAAAKQKKALQNQARRVASAKQAAPKASSPDTAG